MVIENDYRQGDAVSSHFRKVLGPTVGVRAFESGLVCGGRSAASPKWPSDNKCHTETVLVNDKWLEGATRTKNADSRKKVGKKE